MKFSLPTYVRVTEKLKKQNEPKFAGSLSGHPLLKRDEVVLGSPRKSRSTLHISRAQNEPILSFGLGNRSNRSPEASDAVVLSRWHKSRRAMTMSPAQNEPISRRSSHQLTLDMRDLLADFDVFFAVAVDGSDRVQHGCVIAAAEVAADFFEAVARVAAGE